MAPTLDRSARRPLDAVALARVHRRLLCAPAPPWLHGEVARRMAERLPFIKLDPARVLDWGSSLAASRELLVQAYPRAQLLAVESDAQRFEATAALLARPWWSPQRWAGRPAQVLLEADVSAGMGQLVWSNFQLHGALDPQEVMQRWHQALEVGGLLMFSTLGPGSLLGLRSLYARQGWPEPPFAPFVDMHDLGDMLVHAGFADPVMDQETITLTWPTAQALLAELRGLGGNVDPQRFAGLRTPRWRKRLLAAMAEHLRSEGDGSGRLALSFELVYGHAWRPAPKLPVQALTVLPLKDLRDRLRGSGGVS